MSMVVVVMVFMVMRMVVMVVVIVPMVMLVAVLMFVLVAMVVMEVDGSRPGVHVAADLLLAVHRHRHVGAGDAALHRRLGGHLHAGQAQAVHPVQERRLVVHKLQ